jgi:hypothetical protein
MKKILFPAILILAVAFTSCRKKTTEPEPEPEPTPTGPTYTIPTSYTFANVNYTGQTQRLDMMAEMKTYMSTGNTSLTVLSATKLKDMYANANSQFTNTALNSAGKDIKSKTFLVDQTIFETYMDNIAAASTSTVAGSNGVAGVVTSPSNPTKKYLCDANGVEWTQVIEKGIMGSLMYYQTTAVYLDASKIGNSVDNSTVVAGQGTAMEHHWDEAFGYFGVPVDFPTNTAGIRFWGKYCNDRNTILSTNSIMNAFLKGRAAISNKDYTTRDAQVTLIRDTWEKVIAATIISYVNATKTNITDDAVRNHNLSEIKGFLMNLKCNPTKKISATQISSLETLLGTNFYTITITNLDQIKDDLSTIYGLDAVKNTL